ncbi:MAG TPA: hypothetical protein VF503_31640 [Sphingobium sp.]|uniref:hypothetical protein n=1 Tax=Sphingobium sp. TaxID=1912891 RepID=UPI002ED1370D
MLELTESYELRPEIAMREISRARRIRDNLMDQGDERKLQAYIDELEAFLDRMGRA